MSKFARELKNLDEYHSPKKKKTLIKGLPGSETSPRKNDSPKRGNSQNPPKKVLKKKDDLDNEDIKEITEEKMQENKKENLQNSMTKELRSSSKKSIAKEDKEEKEEIKINSSESDSKEEIKVEMPSKIENKNNPKKKNFSEIVIDLENEEENINKRYQNRRRVIRRKPKKKDSDSDYSDEDIKLEKNEIKTKDEDSDIISIHEEERKIMNSINDKKSEIISTPFGKLLHISKEYGFDAIMDNLITFLNTNESYASYAKCGVGINKDMIDVLKKINTETLNLYLIKLLAYNSRNNFKILNHYKTSNDQNFSLFLKQRKKGKNPLLEIISKNIIDDSDVTDDKYKIELDSDDDDDEEEESSSSSNEEDEEDEDDDYSGKKKKKFTRKPKYFGGEEALGGKKTDKRKGTYLHDDQQYRFKHFHMKDGVLNCYWPKRNNVKSLIFNLYCWKFKCPGKMRVNMIEETAYECALHRPHSGLDIQYYIEELL